MQAPETISTLETEIEAETERELLLEAAERVRLRVKPNTWKAFYLTASHSGW